MNEVQTVKESSKFRVQSSEFNPKPGTTNSEPRTVGIVSCPHPFKVERVDHALPAGLTIAEMLHIVQPDPVLILHAHVYVEDQYIKKELWSRVRPKPGARVTVRAVPAGGGGGGGKNPLRTILTLAVIAATIYFAPELAFQFAELGLPAGFIGPPLVTGLHTFAATALIGIGGMLLVNAIAPPSSPKLKQLSRAGGQATDSPTLSIAGSRNQANLFGPVPRVLGRHRMVPPYGAKPFTEIVGDDQFLRMLFVWGTGPLNITDLKIGETDINLFDEVEIETRQGFAADAPLTLYTNDVFQDDLQITLKQVDSWQQRTSQLNADELSVDITFPQGLVEFSGASKLDQSVTVEVEYKLVSEPTLWTVAGSFNVTAHRSSVIRKGLRWTVANGQYDIRLRRTSADTADSTIFDTVAWTALRTITDEDPIAMTGLAKTAIRIKATDQLNGVVDQLNGIVESLVLDWTGSAWVEQATSNPASLFREVLQGKGNARPLADSRIDLATLQDWHDKNAVAGREFNMVVDFQSSVRDMLGNIAAAGRAAPAIKDGKWGVVLDQAQSVPIQHFTPRNSSGFTGEKIFADQPHGFRVRFVNRDKNWLQDERIVYDDGFNAGNATKFEGLELLGVTDPEQIWKDGRYHIATARLRPETYTFNTDIEHIVCTRGDLIRVSHDVPLWGLGSGRVKSVQTSGGNTTGITLDETLTMISGKNYTTRARKSDGTTVLQAVNTVPGETNTLVFTTPFLIANSPEVGDLAMFGESGSESVELIVRSIEPGPDLTARLVCLDAAPAVHNADTGTIPAFNSQITVPQVTAPPSILSLRSDESVLLVGPSGALLTRILITLAPLQNPPLEKLRALEVQFRESSSDGPWTWLAPLPIDTSEVSITEVEDLQTYNIRLRHRFNDESFGDWTTVNNYKVVGKSTVPADVTGLTIGAISGVAVLKWDLHPDIDVRKGGKIMFRHSAALTGASWGASVSIGQEVPGNSDTVVLPLKSGTYLVKAVDSSIPGNQSVNAVSISSKAASVLSFANLSSLAAHPSFTGTHSGTVAAGSVLKLSSGTLIDAFGTVDGIADWDSEGGISLAGTYTMGAGIDLGAVKNVRLESALTVLVDNILDFIDSRTTNIDDWEDFDGTTGAQADVVIEARETDDDPAGSPVWEPWKRLDIADHNARAFQFRAKLSTSDPTFNIQVSALTLTADEVV